MITSWNEVSLEQYIEISEVILTDESSDDTGAAITLLSILLDISEKEVKEMEYSQFATLEEDISFVKRGIPKNDKPFDLVDRTFIPIPFNQLEFGAFIDLEHLLTSGSGSYVHNLHKIFSILFREILTEETELIGATYRGYSGWSDKVAGLFYPVPITQLYYVLIEYMTFRSKLFTNYEGLFSEKDDYDEDEDLSGLSSKERDAIAQEERVSKWGWELLLLKLSNNDPLRIKDATMLPIIQAMNILSMYQELKIGS